MVLEIDMPGHGESWCKGIPDICPSTICLSPLNVANEKTFSVISDIVKEVTGKYPKPY